MTTATLVYILVSLAHALARRKSISPVPFFQRAEMLSLHFLVGAAIVYYDKFWPFGIMWIPLMLCHAAEQELKIEIRKLLQRIFRGRSLVR